ncbi:4-hydroxythreonine-4-phosphate dehydrogenase PdxA [Desulfosporosinus sp. BICA1-9]|uniref:4-hydroxythreonine-4-phosphate dehydrogenase PdxA n=1 Tax=Desulfosporosinus sp. BICA1-9 TaxID=1531958 RepID=UPI00054B0D6C|nr:4-hydroxythreonine-4-phosphate dehydrogenase PdxA [Desulfosporosinus sp. BICA1-9]KJS50833.1 MAG: 4-hydroxythreonine-4-phosphate dehydrogenase [Peptococcaceae bacterium BRH_c23]KJS83443.1 MAG: 4-hydroxythreonine-4-phosphate dehydrogenase [Desulfosporosinus sp. BICA1-9]HBW37373.1 4-hydroxythreonine-4-phosphate dehydrogenase PdxA [Desulfosporosinus sp.]
MNTYKRPIIAITMGDAAGIGPEIIVKALSYKEIYRYCRPLVVGDINMLHRAEGIVHTGLSMKKVETPKEGCYKFGMIDCLDMGLLPDDLPYGKVDPRAGHAAFRYVEKAVNLALAGEAAAICTAPLNKEALHQGGHKYPGHTEILADLTHTERFAMMFCSEQLNVILVTIHVGLLDAIKLVTSESVYDTILLANEAMSRKITERRPRVAVCGINPHAGEHGLFGYGEEEEKILPAVKLASEKGIDVVGPLPADTAFYLARRGDYDIVVAMYHDQGLGPIKVMGIEKSVNITVGLPFIRTSVDHGTAFNIAGTGKADAQNMKEAIRQAWILSGTSW